MGKLDEIYEGWKNYIFPTVETEELAKKRISICVSNECKKYTAINTCSLCGCFMPAKVRSPDSYCKLKKW
jgi:hypothetical protein